MQGPKLLIWGLAAMVLLALGLALVRPAPAVREDIGNQRLRDLQASGARVVDVRTPGEYALGHIPGAQNVPVEQIATGAQGWDKALAVVVYCATGARSANAAGWLAANGFTKVYNLKAGIAAWDGQVTKDVATGATGVKTDGKPILIDFYSDT